MNKKTKYYILVLILLFVVTGCNTKRNINNSNNSNEVINSMKITINNKEYQLNLEDNETARSFINLLPQKYDMKELNGNEKYVYLDTTLPTNEFNPKKINTGDVMLYGNNCLVIFYKTFETSYSYTKIGHIDNLEDLGNEDITVILKSSYGN